MRRVDIGIGVFFVVFGVFALLQSLALPLFQNDGVPGPGMFPALLSGSLIVFGLLLAISRVARDADYGVFALPSWPQLRRVVFVTVALTGSIALLDVIGYFASTLLLCAVLIFGLERRLDVKGAVTVISLPVIFFVLFAVLLDVRLPAGLFGD